MSAGRRKQQGFTLLALLIVVAIMGAGLAAIGELASHAMQREKERELLFIGNEFRDAIAAYYERTPGMVKRYPNTLDDLLADNRFPVPVRHLRRVYRDPFTGKTEWGLIKAPEGGIMGVHSLAEGGPIKTGNFDFRDRALEGAASYSGWQFFYLPPLVRR